MSQSIQSLLAELDAIISRLRIVTSGDLILPQDHNDLVDAIKKIRDILALLSQQAGITITNPSGVDPYTALYKLCNKGFTRICWILNFFTGSSATTVGTTYSLYFFAWYVMDHFFLSIQPHHHYLETNDRGVHFNALGKYKPSALYLDKDFILSMLSQPGYLPFIRRAEQDAGYFGALFAAFKLYDFRISKDKPLVAVYDYGLGKAYGIFIDSNGNLYFKGGGFDVDAGDFTTIDEVYPIKYNIRDDYVLLFIVRDADGEQTLSFYLFDVQLNLIYEKTLVGNIYGTDADYFFYGGWLDIDNEYVGLELDWIGLILPRA